MKTMKDEVREWQVVTKKTTGREYAITAWKPTGSKEQNEKLASENKPHWTKKFDDCEATGRVIRNGKRFGGICTIFKSDVIE